MTIRFIVTTILIAIFTFSAAKPATSQSNPLANLAPITADNARRVKQLAGLGWGILGNVAWSPDGKALGAASSLGVWQYDANALNQPPHLLASPQWCSDAAYSPDGTTVVCSSYTGDLIVWNAKTHTLRSVIAGNTPNQPTPDSLYPQLIAFSPDNSTVATAGIGGVIHIWNTTNGTLQKTVTPLHNTVICLIFSPDGKMLLDCDANFLTFWDTTTWTPINGLFDTNHAFDYASGTAFSPDGSLLATNGDNSINLWNLKALKAAPDAVLSGQNSGAQTIAFSPDGKLIAAGGHSVNDANARVRLWNVTTHVPLVDLTALQGTVRTLSFSPDSSQLAISANEVRVWDVKAKTWRAVPNGYTHRIEDVVISPDNSTVASCGAALTLWDVPTATVRKVLSDHDDVVSYCASFSPDGNLLASGTQDGRVNLWDVKTEKLTGVLQPNKPNSSSDPIIAIIFSPDSKKIVSSSHNGSLWLWDVSSRRGHLLEKGKTDAAYDVRFSSDSKTIVEGSADSKLKLWDANTGAAAGTIETGELTINLTLSPKGTFAAIDNARKDSSVHIWNLTTKTEYAVFKSDKPSISGLVFSSDGSVVVAAYVGQGLAAPADMQIWDMQTGKSLVDLQGHTGVISNLALSADGKLLVTGSYDGTVQFWGVPADS